jgi:hypothetical protein
VLSKQSQSVSVVAVGAESNEERVCRRARVQKSEREGRGGRNGIVGSADRGGSSRERAGVGRGRGAVH